MLHEGERRRSFRVQSRDPGVHCKLRVQRPGSCSWIMLVHQTMRLPLLSPTTGSCIVSDRHFGVGIAMAARDLPHDPHWVSNMGIFACCLYHTCLRCSCCFDEYGRCLFWLSDEEKDELRARAKEREEIRARAMQKKKEEETRARAKKKEETRARSGKSRATAKVKPDNKYETTEVETFAETPPEAETENSSPSKDSPPGRDRILRAALVSESSFTTLFTLPWEANHCHASPSWRQMIKN